ncbi:MAG: tRNA pseudouridine(38-40) synthase TruA [Acidobacteriota bacterium]
MTAKYKATLKYVGTRYAGWQIQKNQNTIQGQLRDALTTITGHPVSVIGSGRTDSGVHAMAQVAHFCLAAPTPREQLFRALNGILPWDIRVMSLSKVPLDFHAQKNALKKRYEYRLYNGPSLSPFLHGYVLHVRHVLDYQAMQTAAQQLYDTHDFSGFAAATTQVKSRTRQIYLSQIQKRGWFVTYRVEANGFLHHMVRNIVGTLLQIGSGKRPPGDIEKILKSKNRRMAGPTAPPQGLYLMKVWY